MKKVLALVLAAVMVFSFAACGKEDKQEATEKIRISVVGPLTGNSAEYGIGFQAAGEMMEKLWNDKGGCAGRPVEIVMYDDKGSIEEDLALAQKIVEDPLNYATVGHFAGPVAVAPIYEEAQVCFVAPAASAVEFTNIGKYIFRNNFTLQLDAKWLTDIAVADGFNEAALIYVQTDWGDGARKTIVDETDKRSDMNIVYTEAIQETQADYSVIINKIKEQGIKAVYIMAFYGNVGPFTKQIKEAIPDIHIYASASVYNKAFLDLAGAEGAGVVCTTAFAAENEEPTAKAWSDLYFSQYGKYPSGQTAQCYDSIGLLLQAIDELNLQQPDGTALRDKLETINYEGICGATSFDELHDAHKPRWVVQVVEGGGAWEVKTSVE